ncbi:MAG: hypothetical protein ACLU0O_02235 [Collinsella sp.]
MLRGYENGAMIVSTRSSRSHSGKWPPRLPRLCVVWAIRSRRAPRCSMTRVGRRGQG